MSVKREPGFSPGVFLSTIGNGKEMLTFQMKRKIFVQGDPADGLFFIQKGRVKLSVASESGKEATLGIVGEGDFFGEGGLAGQLLRLSSASAVTDCVLLHVKKKAMMHAMSREPKLSAMFVNFLLQRNLRYQEDLVDQLFNSSEKRLARVLLLMAHFGKEGESEALIPRLSQSTLAEMVGTTRSRVCFFMNRFRKLGFINYEVGDKLRNRSSPDLRVHSSLLNVVLYDGSGTTPSSRTENLAACAKKCLEPPAKPGGPPDKERAKEPDLLNRGRGHEIPSR